MEDYPNNEIWEIEDYSKSYERNENVTWIWRKGLSLGKKIMITSIMISSAPIVVPPLVAISSFGFVCSLPVGFAIVTYVCTEKLINTLLPMPSSPPLMLDDVTKSFTEKDRRDVDDVEEGHEEDVDMEAEGAAFEEDMRHGMEMRIELVDEVDNETDDYEETPVDTGEGDRSVQASELVMENEEEHLNLSVIPDILEGIRQAEDEIAMMKGARDEMPTSSLQAVVVSAEVGGEDEINVDQVLEEMVIFEPENLQEQNESTEMFSGINEEIRRETTGLIEEMRDVNQENEVKSDISIQDTAESSGSRDLLVIPEEAKPIEDVGGLISAPMMNDTSNHASVQQVQETRPEGDENVSLQAESKPVVRKNLVVNVNTLGDHTITEVRQGNESDWKRGTLVISNEDVREIADESEFNLFDDDTLESDQTTITIDQSSEGESVSDDIIDVNVDYHEVLIVSEISEPKGGANAVFKADSKETKSKEKIWERIQAMRSIVGYKEKPHPSCVEELKALYVFTGVEPPELLEDPADMDEKLHFLMSIAGVM